MIYIGSKNELARAMNRGEEGKKEKKEDLALLEACWLGMMLLQELLSDLKKNELLPSIITNLKWSSLIWDNTCLKLGLTLRLEWQYIFNQTLLSSLRSSKGTNLNLNGEQRQRHAKMAEAVPQWDTFSQKVKKLEKLNSYSIHIWSWIDFFIEMSKRFLSTWVKTKFILVAYCAVSVPLCRKKI